MKNQLENTPQSSRRLAWIGVAFGVLSISPLLAAILTLALEHVFQVSLQWLRDFITWLTVNRIVAYLSLLSLPGLIIEIPAYMRASTGIERGISIFGIILGALGILWAYFMWTVITWTDFPFGS